MASLKTLLLGRPDSFDDAGSSFPLLAGNALAAPLEGCAVQSLPLLAPSLAKFAGAIEPGSDPFLYEQYAADIGRIFDTWSVALRASNTDVTSPQNAVASAVEFTPLRSPERNIRRNGDPIRVASVRFSSLVTTGRDAFLRSLTEYLAELRAIRTAEFLITDLHILKPAPVSVDILVRYDFVGSTEQNRCEERTGLWSLTCQADSRGHWSIDKWRATEDTRASVSGRGFVDITARALEGNAAAQRQFAHGVDYWHSAIDAAAGIDVYGNNGVAVGDFDGDGFDDFYVCQPSGLPNRLFRNRADGTFEDVTERSGLGLLDSTAWRSLPTSPTRERRICWSSALTGTCCISTAAEESSNRSRTLFVLPSRRPEPSPLFPRRIMTAMASSIFISACTPTIKGSANTLTPALLRCAERAAQFSHAQPGRWRLRRCHRTLRHEPEQ